MFNFAQLCDGMAAFDGWLQWLAEQQVDLFRRAVADGAIASRVCSQACSRVWLTNSLEERRLFRE